MSITYARCEVCQEIYEVQHDFYCIGYLIHKSVSEIHIDQEVKNYEQWIPFDQLDDYRKKALDRKLGRMMSRMTIW